MQLLQTIWCLLLLAPLAVFAQSPILTSVTLSDPDLHRIDLQGQNFDAQSYVDIRLLNGNPIEASIFPPEIAYTSLGGTAGKLSFRLNDENLRNKLTLEGLRFYVVSPTAGYAFAGPRSAQRNWPLPTLTGGSITPANSYQVALTGQNCDNRCYVDVRTLAGSNIELSVYPPNLSFTSSASNYQITFEITNPTLRGLLTSQGLRF